jgi:polysaccharide pyruvyl transferase WcaK-like protein
MAQQRHVRTACIGQSIGPLRGRWVRALTRRALERVEVIATRDHHSAGVLRGLGVQHDVAVTGDLAFLLPRPSAEDSAILWRLAGLVESPRPAAALVLRRLPGAADRGWAAAAAHPVLAACRGLGLRPVLVPMQPPDDLALAEEIASQAPDVEVVRAKLTARQTLSLLAGFDVVVAMRLHALIFAAIGRVPLVGVSYDPKVDGLLGELGLAAATSTVDFDAAALEQQLSQVWQERETMARSLDTRVVELHAGAQRNIDLCLRVLGAT